MIEETEVAYRSPMPGDIYVVNLKGIMSEQAGIRPCVVFQNKDLNLHSPNVIVLPMTSKIKHLEFPSHVFVSKEEANLKSDSMILAESPVCVSKSRLGQRVSTMPENKMGEIAKAVLSAIPALTFLDKDFVVQIMSMAQ